ncbi:MAG: DUF6660 family protein [Parafilimonas sp.]
MKFLAFILAFLVLALSVMPCADKTCAQNEGKTKTELLRSDHRQNNQQEDACTPFCHCTCCAGFSINHFIASVSIIPLHDKNYLSFFLSSDLRTIALSIWQPPQLV